VPYQVFATADGFLILAVANDAQFKRFCAASRLDDLARDARFATNADRVGNRQALIALMAPVLAARSTADWIALLEEANVPCGPINRVDQAFSDPQAIARGLTVSLDHAAAGPIALVASPLRLSRTPPEYKSAPPLLGQHTGEVLLDMLGLSDGDISQLRKTGIL